MKSPQQSLSRFSRSLWLTAGSLAVFCAVFAYYVHAEKQIDRANELRLQSFRLASELRQSSDDLTRMVRSYVITGDPIYKQHYQEILDIREARVPRPADYDDIYWDLVLANDRWPRASSGQALPLLELMRKSGFTDAEFAKVAQAKANSDALTATEFAAMSLVESAPVQPEARLRASQMLHDEAYQQAKASIMQPLNELQRLMEQRTSDAVQASADLATWIRWAFVLLCLVLGATLWRVYRSVHRTLGGSVDELHARIARLGSGDFSSLVPVAPGLESSVLGWLSETRMALAKIDAQRLEERAKNQRLTQLYAALSQCSQAIVRCQSEAELFPQICRDAVTVGGMKMAWIGLLDQNSKAVVPVAAFGDGTEYLEGIRISIDASEPQGRGPVGTSMREDRPYWCQDFEHDPATEPWHERGARLGWKASAGLPLHRDGRVIGCFSLYIDSVEAFDEAERSLLVEMTTDIDFALNGYVKEAHIHRLANYDALTGLPNRLLLNDRMLHAITMAQRNQSSLAVMFLDLDHFKDINDTLGHSVGDGLLIEMARRLKATLREEDTVTRLGGDEFILLLPGNDGNSAAQVAEKLIQAITHSFSTPEQELSVSASIGIAIYPDDGEDFETLSKNADTAMYRVKQEGRNGYRFFTAEMQAHSVRKLQLENALRQALANNQMTLHYQPQLALQGGRIVGAEALLRWQHPELGQVSPAEFIPVAEANGLILPIGEWVLQTAVRQIKTWIDQGLGPMVMAVNLSVAQFRHPALPELVSRILDQAQLPPEYLELELTEGVAMENPLGAIAVMDRLHERGVRMSIDDFGTGYSSLNYLKRFKVYKLKIDQSFVRDISTDPEDKAIVSAVISMARSLGLKTIAEGVETQGQLEFLREQGCDEVQGYYFSRPLPAQQFEAFVRERDL